MSRSATRSPRRGQKQVPVGAHHSCFQSDGDWYLMCLGPSDAGRSPLRPAAIRGTADGGSLHTARCAGRRRIVRRDGLRRRMAHQRNRHAPGAGSAPGRCVRMVLREAVGLVGPGVPIALALGRLAASLLYGVSAWDVAAIGTAWLPARRAAYVDPWWRSAMMGK